MRWTAEFLPFVPGVMKLGKCSSLFGDSKQVLPCPVPVVDGIGTKKVSN